jgi:predicted GTPase
MSSHRKNVIIMGAAGRDFHNFNVYFRNNPQYKVMAFTAFQIPNISGRTYPPELAGPSYPQGIPIYDESELPSLIRDFQADEVVFAYSDVPHVEVMHRASRVNALGADFRLMGAKSTMVKSGQSQTARRITELLRKRGKAVVVVRHPMPYGDLNAQRCERLATLEDLDRYQCTIEEREEYEAHIQVGHVVYAGVDYEEILHNAEREADIILWDGGNNDIPFYEPAFHIVIADPHRAGHEILYYPGETNLRMAQLVIVNKVNTAKREGIDQVLANISRINPDADVIRAESVVTADNAEAIRGKRVLVVEDGPTLTHGEMTYGAAHVAARQFGAAAIVDPRPYAAGTIRGVFEKYRHLTDVLPAMGYGDQQVRDLQESIDAVPCDLVLVGTPFDLSRLIQVRHPMIRIRYGLGQGATTELSAILDRFLATLK